MNQHLLFVVVGLLGACLGLNIAGLVVDLTWSPPGALSGAGFFSYKLRVLDGFPYVLLAHLLLIGINGVMLIERGMTWVGLGWGRDGIRGEVSMPHVQFMGWNLLSITLLMLLYILVRLQGL